MDAKGLLNAMIARYLESENQWRFGMTMETFRAHRNGMGDMLIHAASVALNVSEEAATEWVGEELAERRASMG